MLLAAGEGTRLGHGEAKALSMLGGLSLLQRAARTIDAAELVDAVVVAYPGRYDRERVRDELTGVGAKKSYRFVPGGETRQASARTALDAAGDVDAVLVHDAARALAPASLFDAVLRELDACEAVIPVVPSKDTIKLVDGAEVAGTLDRARLGVVQTPQGFRTEVYRRAHEAAAKDGFVGTDDASLVERLGVRVRVVDGDDRNIKITTALDVAVAEALLGDES